VIADEMGRDNTKLYEASSGFGVGGDSKDNVSVVTVMGTDKSREMGVGKEELMARMV
jgi:hypothetical protein